MVNTVKFSQFVNANLNDSSTEIVGLATGQNIKTSKVVTWSTAGRPTPPFNGVLGLNTNLEQYEFWNASSAQWVQLASSVNLTATFILKTPDLTLPNSFALSTLATGILKNHTGTGIPTISAPLTSIDSLVTAADEIIYTTAPNTYAVTTLSTFSRGLLANTTAPQWRTALGVAGIPVNVSQGGTGDTSFTPFSVICGGTTPTGALQNVSGVGTLGQVLTSNGPAVLPSWQTPVASGTVNPGLINELAYYAAPGTVVSGLPTANRGVLATSSTGVPSINTNLLPFIVGPGGFYTTVQAAINDAALVATSTNHAVVLINGGTYAEDLTLVSFVDLASFGGVSNNTVVIEGNAVYNPINDNEEFSASGITFLTPGGGGVAFAINGAKICDIDLNECRFDGTTGTAFECNNANANITKSSCHLNASAGQKILNFTAGNILSLNGKAFATDTASTLSGAAQLILSGCFDNNAFILTGTSQLSAVNSVILTPTTLSFIDIGPTATGIIFGDTIVSNAVSGFWATGTGFIAANAVTSNAGSAPNIDPALIKIQEPLIIGSLSFNGGLNTFNTSGDFNVIQTYTGNTNVTFPTSGTLATTSQLPTLPLSLADGGTNAALVASSGSIVYSTASAMAFSAVGSAGQLLQSSGAGAPGWTTATYPSVATNAGTLLRANGTNWIPSTADFADTYAASNILYSNGANNVVGLATGNNGVLVTDAGGVPSISSTLPLAVQGNITAVGTITTGVWNGTAVDVQHGGTGDTSFTAFSVICGGTTATGNLQNVVGLGAIGQVLTSSGPGALPTWTNAPGTGTVNSGTINDLAYYASSTNAVSPLATTSNGLLVTSNTGVPSILAGPGTTGNVLQSNAAAAPSFSTATYPSIATGTGTILRANGTNWVASTATFADTYTANNLLYASSTNTVTGLATSTTAVLTTAVGVPTWAAQLSLTLGGTNASLTADNGAIVYSTASALALLAHTTTAGLALLSGNNAAPTWSTSPPITQINTQTITATGAFTYTPTTGTKYAIFELQGGGGGSGGSTGAGAQSAVGGSGGGGAYIKLLVSGATNLAAITGSVGIGGTAGSSGNNPGGTGGSTTLVINGGSTWTAAGGTGGGGQTSSAAVQQSGTGGAGGSPTAGTNGTLIMNVSGQTGAFGFNFASAATTPITGMGGNSQLGKGGTANGQVGVVFGGGASGTANASGGSVAGFAGAQGVVIITEFISV